MFQTFYHSLTRKYVIMMGNLFNDIYIRRLNKTGTELQQIKVPISYSPLMKWVALLNKHPADTPAVAIQLPRIGFEVTTFEIDEERKINNIHQLISFVDDNNKVLTQFVPVPYKINFEVYVIAKNTDDALQIIEQIVPYFNNDFNTTLDLIPGSDYKYDIRINMEGGPNKQDVYDGDFQQRRAIIWTLNFSVSGYYFGPTRQSGVIKRVQIDLHALSGSGPVTRAEMDNSGRNVRIVVKPGLTIDGQPTSDPALSIPYQQINKEDDYGYIEEITDYYDGRKYDPVSGYDKPPT